MTTSENLLRPFPKISKDYGNPVIPASSLVGADEHFHRKESGYRLEETARSSQEKHGLLRFQMILECCRALTRMLPFVLAMEEGRYLF